MDEGPAKSALAASWVMILDRLVKEPERRESRDRFAASRRLSMDVCRPGRRGGTMRLSCEYSGLNRLLVVPNDEVDAPA